MTSMTSNMPLDHARSYRARDRSISRHVGSSTTTCSVDAIDAHPKGTSWFDDEVRALLAPDAIAVRFVEANNLDSLADRVGEATDRITDEQGHEPAEVLVVSFSTDVRDRLRHEIGYVGWAHSNDRAIICENVDTVDDLEFDHVVLAAASDSMSDVSLHVSLSRARTSVTVIGPRGLAGRLGLATEALRPASGQR